MRKVTVTMREIAEAVNKPQSTVYRWKNENPDLFTAARIYAEMIKTGGIDKSGRLGDTR